MFKYVALLALIGLTACNNTPTLSVAKPASSSSDCLSLNIADCAVVHSPVNH